MVTLTVAEKKIEKTSFDSWQQLTIYLVSKGIVSAPLMLEELEYSTLDKDTQTKIDIADKIPLDTCYVI